MPSIKRNYFCNLTYQILSIVTPFITTPYISRVFGAYNIGVYSYTNSVLAYFLLFSALGTSFYGKREIARYRDNKKKLSETFWEIFLLCLFSTTICSFLWLLFIFIQNEFTLYFSILSLNIIAVPFDITWFFIGIECFDKILKRNLVVRLISILLLFLVVREKEDLWKYMLLISLTSLLGNISMWLYLKEYLIKVEINYKRIKFHFSQTIVYFIPTIATVLYTVLDRTMLHMIIGDLKENGYYEQAIKICNIPMQFILALDSVVGSRITYLIEKSRDDEVKARLAKSLSFVALTSIPMVLGIAAIIEKFVPWFLGNEFHSTIGLVYIYSPLIICVAINNFLSEQYLTPAGKRKQTAIIVIISAAINFILNLLIIPRYYSYGAAFTSVISEAFIAISYIFMSRNVLPIRKYAECFWRNIIAGIVMFACVNIFTHKWNACITTTIMQISIGAFTYITMLFMLKDCFFKELITVFISRRK